MKLFGLFAAVIALLTTKRWSSFRLDTNMAEAAEAEMAVAEPDTAAADAGADAGGTAEAAPMAEPAQPQAATSEAITPEGLPDVEYMDQPGRPSTVPAKRALSWVPPPGAFNEADLPCFCGPGPGRYTPTIKLVKPRTLTSTFPTEDRWKHLGRQRDSSKALDGSLSSATMSTWGPQIAMSPGPVYLPSFDAVEIQSRSTSFPGAARIKATAGSGSARAKSPGPGAYTPIEQYVALSNKPRLGKMATFSADDRYKYLGEQLQGGTVVRVTSPGPAYAPKFDLTLKSDGAVSFGQPRKLGGRPILSNTTPGPGSYSPPSQADVLSMKPNVPAPSFGREPRFRDIGAKDDAPLMARRASTPGPKYLPSYDLTRPKSRSAKIGTAKRFGGNCVC